jgi:hypothetical protein
MFYVSQNNKDLSSEMWDLRMKSQSVEALHTKEPTLKVHNDFAFVYFYNKFS